MRKYYTQPLASELIEAYHNTDYCFTANDQEHVIRLDNQNADFTVFLEANQIKEWAFITAWNPYSISMPNAYNDEHQQKLFDQLDGCRVWKGEGRGRDDNWTPEESYFVADIKKHKAIRLGRAFGQNAIVVGKSDGKAILETLFENLKYSFRSGRLIIERQVIKSYYSKFYSSETNRSKLTKVVDILNCEGPLLSLYKDNINRPYLMSRFNDGSGEVYYATNINLLQQYFDGVLTTTDLIEKSNSATFFKQPNFNIRKTVSVVKSELKEVSYAQEIFTNIPKGTALTNPEKYLIGSYSELTLF